jgi:predicted O-methyltransferase YrrM
MARLADLSLPVRGAARTLLSSLERAGASLRRPVNAAVAPGPAPGGPSPGPEFVPAGHFYSALPDLGRVRADAARLFPDPPRTLPGIDLREAAQLRLLEKLRPLYDTQPFPALRTPELRYFFENPAFGYPDALALHMLLRHLRPRRLVEVGCGYSSAVTLDTNDLFLGGRTALTFIEPHPELLRSLLRPGDADRITVLGRPVQEVPLAVFEPLGPGDVLFIDSTHVSKVGSDVNHLYHEVLPRLRPGVLVHVHDVFHPFEYPLEWIVEGRAWSEAYLLRAFLTGNPEWEIVLFNSFLMRFHRAWFAEHMPLFLKLASGGSLWLRRVRAPARRRRPAGRRQAPPAAPLTRRSPRRRRT